MSTIAQVAQAFVDGKPFARCHNARTVSGKYVLHGHIIATRHPDGTIELDWCGYYTVATANHLNHILAALGRARNSTFSRVSYAQARKAGDTSFIVRPLPAAA